MACRWFLNGFAGQLMFGLQQTQLTSTCDRFGTPLNAKFAKDFPIVSFHRVQGEEKPLTHLLIRKSLSNQVQDFQLALAQWLQKRLGRGPIRWVFAHFKYSQQLSHIIWHHLGSYSFGQEVSHRETFINKETDEAARCCQHQRVE